MSAVKSKYLQNIIIIIIFKLPRMCNVLVTLNLIMFCFFIWGLNCGTDGSSHSKADFKSAALVLLSVTVVNRRV